MKKTPWFGSGIKPVRAGVYQIRYDGDQTRTELWCRWTGEFWCTAEYEIEEAVAQVSPGYVQCKQWRGIQGDEHSCQIGANTYAVEFDEGPDRPGDGE
ncbi:hypothetical protein LL999_23130 [Burkholderia ambifaria]|uniref:hypothetical protein n=1 Tax=Burkholderia ambifaria TaxID=152480 RepID=UPI001E5F3A8C|nr:hypothetical protein [Burkholderia ambifaria]UEP23140.1 hypothetical protein LL999_23130 [Burkholderia ambifaria]